MYTSKWFNLFRSVIRFFGITKIVGHLMQNGGYEEKFSSALMGELREGDTVWDIGANLGVYTTEFAECAGVKGCVLAFEPVESCYEELVRATERFDTIRCFQYAVSAEDGKLSMILAEDETGATHRVSVDTSEKASYEVDVMSPASIVSQLPDSFPNVVKIDVEGHEGEVIKGMSSLLKDASLRCIAIEVHFALLAERDEQQTPELIETTLQNAGFVVSWTDPSHIVAVKG
jgi:FkbM family methyltransferase